jgi:hypothetical protein
MQTHIQGHQRETIHQQWWLWQKEQTGGLDAMQTIARKIGGHICCCCSRGVAIAIKWEAPVVAVAVVSRL